MKKIIREEIDLNGQETIQLQSDYEILTIAFKRGSESRLFVYAIVDVLDEGVEPELEEVIFDSLRLNRDYDNARIDDGRYINSPVSEQGKIRHVFVRE